MAEEAKKQNWLIPVLATWLAPGAGYFLLKQSGRGAATAASVVIMFTLGLLMRGYFFEPQTGEMLTTVIYCGGWLASLSTGALYFLAKGLGYNAPDVANHVVDYGTKFLVGAGLLNVLAMVDVWEIATGRKK